MNYRVSTPENYGKNASFYSSRNLNTRNFTVRFTQFAALSPLLESFMLSEEASGLFTPCFQRKEAMIRKTAAELLALLRSSFVGLAVLSFLEQSLAIWVSHFHLARLCS